MSVQQAREVRLAALTGLVPFVLMMEPGMPEEEAIRLAEGVLAMIVEWSVAGKSLPPEVNEFLTLAPWKRGLPNETGECPACRWQASSNSFGVPGAVHHSQCPNRPPD